MLKIDDKQRIDAFVSRLVSDGESIIESRFVFVVWCCSRCYNTQSTCSDNVVVVFYFRCCIVVKFSRMILDCRNEGRLRLVYSVVK